MFSVNLFNPYYLHHHQQLRHRTPSGQSLCNQIPCSCHMQESTLYYAFYKYTSCCFSHAVWQLYQITCSSSSGAGGKSVSIGLERKDPIRGAFPLLYLKVLQGGWDISLPLMWVVKSETGIGSDKIACSIRESRASHCKCWPTLVPLQQWHLQRKLTVHQMLWLVHESIYLTWTFEQISLPNAAKMGVCITSKDCICRKRMWSVPHQVLVVPWPLGYPILWNSWWFSLVLVERRFFESQSLHDSVAKWANLCHLQPGQCSQLQQTQQLSEQWEGQHPLAHDVLYTHDILYSWPPSML